MTNMLESAYASVRDYRFYTVGTERKPDKALIDWWCGDGLAYGVGGAVSVGPTGSQGRITDLTRLDRPTIDLMTRR